MKDLRRTVVIVVIVSFSVAALMGIAALLGAGAFGETEGRVLLTTVIVGVAATTVLALLTVAGHPWAPLGLVGGAAALVATACALTLTWGDLLFESSGDDLVRVFAVSAIVAGTCAQLSLLVALVLRPTVGAGLGGLLAATGVAAVVVALMAILPIVAVDEFSDAYWRLFGVVAILDVLGSVVVMALGAFGAARRAIAPAAPVGAPAPDAAWPGSPLTLTADQQERVAALAAARATTPDRILAAALDAYLP